MILFNSDPRINDYHNNVRNQTTEQGERTVQQSKRIDNRIIARHNRFDKQQAHSLIHKNRFDKDRTGEQPRYRKAEEGRYRQQGISKNMVRIDFIDRYALTPRRFNIILTLCIDHLVTQVLHNPRRT